MNSLNDKVNAIFPGRVVRKDLVQRVKKGTNAPTFVLEFLLARYCASDDPDEIEAGLEAVNETLQGNFVRPNESNAAQSLVAQKGSQAAISANEIEVQPVAPIELKDRHFTIRYGDTGYSYRSIFGEYLAGAKKLVVEDPYIRRDHQIRNFLQLCELAVEVGTIKTIELVTAAEHPAQQAEASAKLDEIKEALADSDVAFSYRFDDKIHDREIRTDTGWHIQLGRGLDIYQGPITRLRIGATNYDLRPCMETKVNIYQG